MYLVGILYIQTCFFINVEKVNSDMTLYSYVQLLPETFFTVLYF